MPTSLSGNVNSLAMRVATESKSLRTLLNGNALDNSSLLTTAKGNLVAAINELYDAVSAASGIDDGTTSTTSTWSSSKITSEITADVAALIVDTGTATDSVWSSSKTSAEIDALIDDTATATTTVWSSDKTNTEIGSQITAAVADFTEIDDTTASSTTVYSSTKTDAQVAAAVAALLDSAPGTLDTLNELAAALGDDANFSTTVTTALGNRVRVDNATQGLTGTQQTNARTNIAAAAASDLTTLTAAVGDTTTNFVTTFEAGL